MKNMIAIICIAAATAVPVGTLRAEEPVQEGFSLIEEGTKLLFRGLMQNMEPAFEDLESLAEEMGPMMLELQGVIGNLSAYHAPEVLPNGDIIIRRKSPLEPADDQEIEI